jgi:hypothetical protein
MQSFTENLIRNFNKKTAQKHRSGSNNKINAQYSEAVQQLLKHILHFKHPFIYIYNICQLLMISLAEKIVNKKAIETSKVKYILTTF